MALNDQKLRYKRIQTVNDSLGEIINRQINRSDLANLNRSKDIIRRYGWPKISDIGKDGQNNLWLIVQHADQDVLFQQTALVAMKKLKAAKEINLENYAFLYDRVQCNLNYKQLYGTQVVWTKNGEASAFRPITKEYMTDGRRRKLGLLPLEIYALTYGFTYHKITAEQSEYNDSAYRQHVRLLIDSAKYFYTKNQFEKTYDYYNTASTFPGEMNDADNFDAAIIFSKIAAIDDDSRYKSIALDFLELLYLRKRLTRKQLVKQPAFRILYKDRRWISIYKHVS